MKLSLVKYKCACCQHEFEAPELMPGAYGEFLLRSAAGEAAHLDALTDRTYDEVTAILERLPRAMTLSQNERAVLLRKIYGLAACDADSLGNTFILGAHPPCPKCACQQMKYWEFVEPAQVVELSIPPVKHSRWQALDEQGRIEVVKQAVTAM
jgi:hypothetical protein